MESTDNANGLRLSVPRTHARGLSADGDPVAGGSFLAEGQQELPRNTQHRSRRHKLFSREPKHHLISRIRHMNRLELFRLPLWVFIPIGLALFIVSLVLVYVLATAALGNIATTPALPSISETGSIYPQYGLFAFTLTWVGVGLLILFIFKFWQLRIVQKTLKLRSTWNALFTALNYITLLTGVMCAITLSLVGVISVGPHPDAHYALTGIFLVFLVMHILLVMATDILFLILVQLKIRDRKRRIESIRRQERELQMQIQVSLPEVDDLSRHSGVSMASTQYDRDVVEQMEQAAQHAERRDRYLPVGLIVYRFIVSILFTASWIVMLLALLGNTASTDTVFAIFEFVVIFFAMCFFASYAYDFRVGFQTSILIFERDTSLIRKKPFKRSIFAAKSVNTPASALATPVPETISVQESQA